MTDRYPYRHHGPAVHGSKLTDYLISEANMIEDIEQLRAENALLPCPFCGGSSLVVRETYKPLKKFEVFCRGNYTRACDAAMWGETRDRAICEWNTRAILSADPAPVSNGPDWEGFGRALMEDFPKGDIDGRDLFDLALNYRLIIEVPGGYDPEEHIDAEGICPDKGDLWFEYNFRGERQ